MVWTLRSSDGTTRHFDRPVVMGILNVTPDSFSDGGAYADDNAAVDAAERMIAAGADIIDVGGESTRPGAGRVDVQEQLRRVVPVIRALKQRCDEALVSIDTTQATVAEAALDAGAVMLNDISAGRDDPQMFALAAQRRVPIVLVHMQGQPHSMQNAPRYDDVVAEVTAFLAQRAAAAINQGVEPDRIVVDPGIGFGKTSDHNLVLLAHLDRLVNSGFAVLLGTSRKRFLGQFAGAGDASDPRQRVHATCATTALGVGQGAAIFRVHDVLANRQTADAAHAIGRCRAQQPTRD